MRKTFILFCCILLQAPVLRSEEESFQEEQQEKKHEVDKDKYSPDQDEIEAFKEQDKVLKELPRKEITQNSVIQLKKFDSCSAHCDNVKSKSCYGLKAEEMWEAHMTDFEEIGITLVKTQDGIMVTQKKGKGLANQISLEKLSTEMSWLNMQKKQLLEQGRSNEREAALEAERRKEQIIEINKALEQAGVGAYMSYRTLKMETKIDKKCQSREELLEKAKKEGGFEETEDGSFFILVIDRDAPKYPNTLAAVRKYQTETKAWLEKEKQATRTLNQIILNRTMNPTKNNAQSLKEDIEKAFNDGRVPRPSR